VFTSPSASPPYLLPSLPLAPPSLHGPTTQFRLSRITVPAQPPMNTRRAPFPPLPRPSNRPTPCEWRQANLRAGGSCTRGQVDGWWSRVARRLERGSSTREQAAGMSVQSLTHAASKFLLGGPPPDVEGMPFACLSANHPFSFSRLPSRRPLSLPLPHPPSLPSLAQTTPRPNPLPPSSSPTIPSGRACTLVGGPPGAGVPLPFGAVPCIRSSRPPVASIVNHACTDAMHSRGRASSSSVIPVQTIAALSPGEEPPLPLYLPAFTQDCP